VENGRWLVRAAATGVSGVISPRGRWVARVPALEAGYDSAYLQLLDHRTLYNRWGDWPLLGLSLLLLVLAYRAPLATTGDTWYHESSFVFRTPRGLTS
jgi:apolipoprotein N-acyltransferase